MLALIWLLCLTLQVKKQDVCIDGQLFMSVIWPLTGQTRPLSAIKQARVIKTRLSDQQHDRLVIPTEAQGPKI